MNRSERILITGASGLVGTNLTELLTRNGYEVWHLSRSKRGKVKTFVWDVEKGTMEDGAFDGVDTIVHLAGANVAEGRWTEKRKKEIIDSRVKSTELIYGELRKRKHQVKNFISASAVGYYGFKEPEKIFSESSPAGHDFLARVTKQWEESSEGIEKLGIRVARMRIGVVLSKNDGAIKPMARTVRWFIGSPLGSGDQYISWIHINDLCRMFLKVIEDPEIQGAVNAVAPHPVTNRELTKLIAETLRKPLILPAVPGFVLRILFGEMGDIVLEGSRVSNKKITDKNFEYHFPTARAAVSNLLMD